MNYQQLQDYALQCALEHHLCDMDDLAGKTPDEVLAMVEEGDVTIVIYEPYEFYEPSSLAEAIEDLRGSHLYNFMEVLTQVNGADWVANFKEGK